MKTLFILDDPAHGTARSCNGLRLATAVAKHDDAEVVVIGGAVTCAMTGQTVPDGYYHLDRMILGAVNHGAEIGCCGPAWTLGHHR